MYRELGLLAVTCYFGAVAGVVAAGAAAGAAFTGAGAVAAGGGAVNSFCAFFQSWVTPQPHGIPTSNHAKATSAAGVFFTCSILYAPSRVSCVLLPDSARRQCCYLLFQRCTSISGSLDAPPGWRVSQQSAGPPLRKARWNKNRPAAHRDFSGIPECNSPALGRKFQRLTMQ